MTIERDLRPLSMLTLATLGSGCISVFPEGAPPSALYAISPAPGAMMGQAERPAPASMTERRSNLVVGVGAPHGQLQLGDSIVWRTGSSYAFMEGAVWAAPARELLQSLLTRSLDEGGGLRAAHRLGEGARADLVLHWTIHAFEIEEEGGALSARFAATAQLLDARRRTLIDVARVNTTAPLARRSAGEAVSALQAVAEAGMAQFEPWVVAQAIRFEGSGAARPALETLPDVGPQTPEDEATVAQSGRPPF